MPTTVEFDDDQGVKTANTKVWVDRGGNICLAFFDDRTGEDLGVTVFLGAPEVLDIVSHAGEAAEIMKNRRKKEKMEM